VQTGDYIRASTDEGIKYGSILLISHDTLKIREGDNILDIGRNNILSLEIRQGTDTHITEGLLIGSVLGLVFGLTIRVEGYGYRFFVLGPAIGTVVGVAIQEPVWADGRLPP
jgi:hypothetical protein